jgi:hypothetical protein
MIHLMTWLYLIHSYKNINNFNFHNLASVLRFTNIYYETYVCILQATINTDGC